MLKITEQFGSGILVLGFIFISRKMYYLLLFWEIKLIFSVSVAHRGRLWAIIKGQAGVGLRSAVASV